MSANPSPLRLAVEGVVAAAAGVGASLVIYSDYWRECCRVLNLAVVPLLVPSYVFAIILGGGVHSATKSHYYVGVVLQFLLMWFLARWFIAWRSERRAQQSSAGTTKE